MFLPRTLNDLLQILAKRFSGKVGMAVDDVVHGSAVAVVSSDNRLKYSKNS
jgi:hypothetical protein